MVAAPPSVRRRSPRLNPPAIAVSAISTCNSGDGNVSENEVRPKRKATRGRPVKKARSETDGEKKNKSDSSENKRRKSSRVATPKKGTAAGKPSKTGGNNAVSDNNAVGNCLPRTRELALKGNHEGGSSHPPLHVMGIDEAGRGPLAGPVVAAAAILPVDIEGITDSKKITKEVVREELYGKIVSAPGVRWAAAVVDAGRIDESNILQATMEAMRMAAEAVVSPPTLDGTSRAVEASVDRLGCYVVCGANDGDGNATDLHSSATTSTDVSSVASLSSHYALVDGNKVPTDMPCEAEAMVKGDLREFCIGAASIIAKVTRDRLMNDYADMFPEFNLAQHKGYPTAAHMAAVRTHGASPIHRRTFAPLKHMAFDDKGQIIVEDSS